MSLVKYRNGASGYYPTNMGGLLERFFNDSLYDNTQVQNFVPEVDILESDKTYEIHFAVPGFEKGDFNLNVDDKMLTVSGERKFDVEKTEKKFKSVRTSYGTFERSFTLPKNVNANKIEANYTNGILEVVIPKDETKIIKTSIKVK
ncbi:MAG: Hsp20/alpha crystallin family protein [Bacteroidetes bacterium]|nr:MAG: Hsp20/alpha crystallin family protein [Bacteroidota bacterium]